MQPLTVELALNRDQSIFVSLLRHETKSVAGSNDARSPLTSISPEFTSHISLPSPNIYLRRKESEECRSEENRSVFYRYSNPRSSFRRDIRRKRWQHRRTLIRHRSYRFVIVLVTRRYIAISIFGYFSHATLFLRPFTIHGYIGGNSFIIIAFPLMSHNVAYDFLYSSISICAHNICTRHKLRLIQSNYRPQRKL